MEGTATCAEGSWSFRYPALTCDESPRLSAWLRDVADAVQSAPTDPLTFVEPNVSLTAIRWTSTAVLIDVGIDLEFAPPWQPRHAAGNPYHLRCEADRAHLLQAAHDWDTEIAPYPDR